MDVPAGVVAIVDKMMAKLPTDRYATPREVEAALGQFANFESAREQRAGPKRASSRTPTMIEQAPAIPESETADAVPSRPPSNRERSSTLVETPPELTPSLARPRGRAALLHKKEV